MDVFLTLAFLRVPGWLDPIPVARSDHPPSYTVGLVLSTPWCGCGRTQYVALGVYPWQQLILKRVTRVTNLIFTVFVMYTPGLFSLPDSLPRAPVTLEPIE